MALYIKPPSGAVSFNKLHSFVMKRLAFLHYIYGHSVDEITKIIERETLAENSECLIEGTAKDKISHFTLRFLCASDNGLQDFFVQTEVKLFSYRLQFCDFCKLRQMLQKASDQSKAILSSSSYILYSYYSVLKSLIYVTEQVQTIITGRSSFINVPFTSALKFVAERLYPLHLGYICLPIKDLKSFLIVFFHELLLQGMKQMRITLKEELDDPRMQYMLQKVKKWLHSNCSLPSIASGKRFVPGCNLMEESKKFPLCMNNLFHQLLRHHRLKHTSRIQLTLFLKEIGVPSSDVIKLFMKEYSMPLDKTCDISHGQCCHNWNDSEKRYIYSIEHLYGLRGARKNYKAHSCETLQNTYISDGGCPFVTFDDQHLQKTFESQNLQVKDIEDIITMVNQKKYNKACCTYLNFRVNIQHQKAVKKDFQTHNEKPETSNPVAGTDSSVTNSSLISILDSFQDNYLLSTSLLKKFSSPSDFYSILSSYVD